MPAEARKAYETALAIRQKLADAHPAVTEYQSNLATSHNDLGILLSETGAPAEARKAYETALAIRQKLADAHPSVTEYQSNLATSHNTLGILFSATGRRPRPARLSRRPWRFGKSWPTPTPPSPSTRATWRAATTTSVSC